MIKWVWIFLLLFIVSLASVYIFIPAKLSVSESELINCTASGASRLMQDENKWAEWWPGQNSKDPDSTLKMKNFTYNGYSYQLTKFFYNRILVLTQKDKTEINTFLNILPVSKDTIITQWQ